MNVQIRPATTDDEWRQHAFVAAYAFNQDRGDEARDRKGQYYQRDWTLAAFDGDELVAGLVIIPFEQFMDGAKIPLGGIASVSCLPERRRGGYVSALLRHSLESMRDAGQILSLLGTRHFSLYRKYGWELAGRVISYSFPPKATKLRQQPAPGRVRRVGPDDWALLDSIYVEHHGSRNGALGRSEPFWRTQKFRALGHVRDAVVAENRDGQPRGYAVYHTAHRSSNNSPYGETTLRVEDWAALDAESYGAILQYLLNHDLVDQIVLTTSQDEPFADMLEEPVHVTEPHGAWFGHMLRVVDVQRAVQARPALPRAAGRAVTIAVADAAAAWNEATWRIECRDGMMSAERTKTAPELSMDVGALGPLYNGFTKPIDAVRAGTIRVHDAAAVEAATEIFATRFAPYCPDDF